MFPRTRFKIFAYSILLVIAIGLLIWWSFYNAAKGRDYERLGEMKILQSELNYYFLNFDTYEIPGCQIGSPVNLCVGENLRWLNIGKIIDPKNSGNFQFIVAELSPDNFKINFSLETGVGGLPRGNYILTKEGIGR
ncbi:MAG: hypothetical protein AAB358_01205 [Patescibacteria group bacterium]